MFHSKRDLVFYHYAIHCALAALIGHAAARACAFIAAELPGHPRRRPRRGKESLVKLIFTVVSLWNAFNELTEAARGDVGLPQLMDAAVRFTGQLAIEAGEGEHDWGAAHDLEGVLIAKLATWGDNGEMTLRLWTYDMSCVIDGLTRAAQHYAQPHPRMVKYVMETLPQNLTIAAVAFTIQLVLEETELAAVGMRELESTLIRKLEAPWEFGAFPLSVDVQDGHTWEALSEKE